MTPLSENQQRHLLATCQYIDRLLGEMETILAAAELRSPFNRYITDTTPAHREVVHDYFIRIRGEIVRAIASENLEPCPPDIPVTYALRTHLSFIDVAVEELKPSYMRGYGGMTPEVAERLSGIVAELEATIGKLDQHLVRGISGDTESRLARLEAGGADVAPIRLLQEVIDRHGFTEFRPALEILLDRYGDRHFEIAVFGRVSTGKSSLLNRLLQIDILPVGVNPITAIPTRLVHGAPLRAALEFLTGSRETIDVGRLAEFVSEEQNPGNTRRISRVTVYVPSERLRDGVVFVDTPGLGSLATSGAAETLAYLPRCDLAFVLLDAASTLTPDDVSTIRALTDAATPILVLLGKADLLSEVDLQRARAYVARQLTEQLGAALTVSPVSAIPAFAARLDEWFRSEVEPLLGQHDELRRRSIARKAGALREAMVATLERLLLRRGHVAGDPDAAELAARLRAASLEFERARTDGEAIVGTIGPTAPRVLARTAAALAARGPNGSDNAGAALRAALDEVMTEVTAPLLARLDALLEATRDVVRGFGDVPAALETPHVLRELPRPDLGQVQPAVKPGLARLFGARATVRAFERALDGQAGTEVQAAADTYAGLVRQWYLRTLRRVRAEFEMVADQQRAHTLRMPGGSAPDRAALAEDLERLRAAGVPRPGDTGTTHA